MKTIKPIIEFVGLPGCGKSTLVKSIVEGSTNKENIVLYSDIIHGLHRIERHPVLTLFYFVYYSFYPIFWKIFNFAMQYPLDKMRVNRVIFLTRLIVNIKKYHKTKTIILDEGIIQFISSIPHNLPIENDNVQLMQLLQSIVNITKEIIVIECNLPIGEDIKRLRERNRNDRFNRIRDVIELKELLHIKQENLRLLTGKMITKKIITINMEDSIEKNRKKILEQI